MLIKRFIMKQRDFNIKNILTFCLLFFMTAMISFVFIVVLFFSADSSYDGFAIEPKSGEGRAMLYDDGYDCINNVTYIHSNNNTRFNNQLTPMLNTDGKITKCVPVETYCSNLSKFIQEKLSSPDCVQQIKNKSNLINWSKI